jgi:hypothetical protein
MKDFKKEVLAILKKYELIPIRWDRTIFDQTKEFWTLYVYGWINNPRHKRGDFILCQFNYDLSQSKMYYEFVSSSKQYSQKFKELFKDSVSIDCVKFKDFFGGSNGKN